MQVDNGGSLQERINIFVGLIETALKKLIFSIGYLEVESASVSGNDSAYDERKRIPKSKREYLNLGGLTILLQASSIICIPYLLYF